MKRRSDSANGLEGLLAAVFQGQPLPNSIKSGLLSGGEVAKMFRVSPRTVLNWAEKGLIPSVLTLVVNAGTRRTISFELRKAKVLVQHPDCAETVRREATLKRTGPRLA